MCVCVCVVCPDVQAADTDQSGFLTQAQVKSVLKELSYRTLGLSTLQLVTLLSEAPLTPDGRVQYVKFVPVAAAMVLSMYDVDTMKLKLQVRSCSNSNSNYDGTHISLHA